jgi:hypothetical protein
MLRKGWLERQLGPGGAPQYRITEAGKAAIAAKFRPAPQSVKNPSPFGDAFAQPIAALRSGNARGWRRGILMISVLIGVLIIVVIGAICFWAIDKFANDRRLAQLLKLLVILICLGAILQRVLPLVGTY